MIESSEDTNHYENLEDLVQNSIECQGYFASGKIFHSNKSLHSAISENLSTLKLLEEKEDRLRKNVIDEIINTEKVFANDMSICLKVKRILISFLIILF